MKKIKWLGIVTAGFCAGAVNGLFGAGGGMVLVPLLGLMTDLKDNEVFPASVSIILPACLVSLSFAVYNHGFEWNIALPYLLGGAIGGVFAGLFGRKIPLTWLHRVLGILILWGGFRYLC